MIAWTSPLRTVRSMPLRISRVGSALGTTCRSRIVRCSCAVWESEVDESMTRDTAGAVLVSVICPLGRQIVESVVGMARTWSRKIGQGDRIERVSDGVADLDPQHVHVAE